MEVAMACVKVLSQHMPKETEENHSLESLNRKQNC